VSLWLTNHLAVWALLLVFVPGVTGLAILGCIRIRRRFPSLADGDHRDVAGVVIGIFGAIYGIVLAFVIVALWEGFQTSHALASTESTELAQMVRAIRAFPPEAEFTVREAIQEYVHAVVEDEWKAMAQGHKSARATAGLDNLYSVLQAYEPELASESAFYDQAVSALNEVTSTRRARLEASSQRLPGLFLALVLGGAVIVIGMTYLLDVRSEAIHLMFVGAVAGLVGFNLLLVVVMDHPFSGQLAIGNAPFKEEAMAQFWAVKGGEALTDRTYLVMTPEDMVGVWNSEDFGVVVFRVVDGQVRGSYRYDGGTIVGNVNEGVFVGWWCEAPARLAPQQAGDVEFRLADTAGGRLLDGRWRYGTTEPYKESWDSRRVDVPEPADLATRFGDSPSFCNHP
jgi:hypothetical protein